MQLQRQNNGKRVHAQGTSSKSKFKMLLLTWTVESCTLLNLDQKSGKLELH